MTLKPVRKTKEYAPPAEMVGEDDVSSVGDIEALNAGVAEVGEKVAEYVALTSSTPAHDWIAYFGTDTAFGPDLYPLQPDAKLFVVTGEFTKLNPARMTVGELIDAKDKLVAPVLYRVS